MKVDQLIFVAIVFLGMESCASFKPTVASVSKKNEVIKKAILDFSHTGEFKRGTVFSISFYDTLNKMVLKDLDVRNSEWVVGKFYTDIQAVSIIANDNKLLLPDSIKIGSMNKLPSQYMEIEGRLFYWWDDETPLNQNVIDVYKRYNLLVKNDLEGIIEIYDSKIGDTQKGVHYYFCKNDLSKY
ncbi:MAG: hypothetical protein OEW87_14215, partial [Flavobacteriaceae bacterium]|nr:hypothetical protein [Flavobacteriaceae bacterium]